MFCDFCGEMIPDNAKFCFKCGKQILQHSSGMQYQDTEYQNYQYQNPQYMNPQYNNMQYQGQQYSGTYNQGGSSISNIQTKVFSFRSTDLNSSIMKKINKWFLNNSIIIHSISISTAANHHVPLLYQTVPVRIELEYIQSPYGNKRYQIGFFKDTRYLSIDYRKLDKLFDRWRDQNTDKHVVWVNRSGHQVRGGCSTMSLYYIYEFIQK